MGLADTSPGVGTHARLLLNTSVYTWTVRFDMESVPRPRAIGVTVWILWTLNSRHVITCSEFLLCAHLDLVRRARVKLDAFALPASSCLQAGLFISSSLPNAQPIEAGPPDGSAAAALAGSRVADAAAPPDAR